MPLQLLPATAQAFSARAAPNIVLGSRVEPWLTQTLKRVNRVKRPLNSVPQHRRCLVDTLGAATAIWTLASIMLPRAPDSELLQDDNPLVQALYNYQLLHIEAYVVHVDLVSQHEVAFKLTPETIDALVGYHRDIYCIDVAAVTPAWPEKDAQLRRMQADFVQAANRFVFRASARALEGLEDDGAGELLDGRSEDVKAAIMGLFIPLQAPPPRIVDVIHPAPLMPSAADPSGLSSNPWWPTPTQQHQQQHSQMHLPSHQHTLISHQPAPVDAWKVLPSTPSPTDASSCSDGHTSVANAIWHDSLGISADQLPSPTPSFSQPVSYPSACAHFYDSPPQMTSMPSLHMPNVMPAHCGTDMNFGGFGDFGWSQGNFITQYATAM